MADDTPMDQPIDDNFGQFPIYMLSSQDVFRFSNEHVQQIAKRFQNSSDLIEGIKRLKTVISSSDLDEDEKRNLIGMLNDEIDIISFAGISRNSVISV